MERGRGAALRGVWMLEPGRDGLAFARESRMHRGQLGYRGPRPGPAQQGACRFHGRLRSRRLRSAAHVERGRYQCAVDWRSRAAGALARGTLGKRWARPRVLPMVF